MRRNLHLLVVLGIVSAAILGQTGVAAARGGGGGTYVHGCTNPLYTQNTCIRVDYTPNGSLYTVSQITDTYDNNSSTTTYCGKYAVENASDAYIFGPSANSYCYGPGGGNTFIWKPGKNYASGYTFCAEFSSTAQEACVNLP